MRKTEEYKVETELGQIAVADRQGSGMPILLLHATGFSKEVFAAQFADPALADFRLIALDLPGHGQSDDAPDAAHAYSLPGLARAVAAVIEELGILRCIVAGWSLGGHVAIETLGTHCPVAGVAAFGAPPVAHGALGMIRGFHFTRDMLTGSKAKLSWLEALKLEKFALGAQSDGRFVETILRADDRFRPIAARDLFFGKGCDQLATVLSSPVPVALIQGEHDPLVRTGYVCTLRAPSLDGGACHIVADAGHAPFMEQPEAFNALLARFAKDVAEGRTAGAPSRELRKAG